MMESICLKWETLLPTYDQIWIWWKTLIKEKKEDRCYGIHSNDFICFPVLLMQFSYNFFYKEATFLESVETIFVVMQDREVEKRREWGRLGFKLISWNYYSLE